MEGIYATTTGPVARRSLNSFGSSSCESFLLEMRQGPMVTGDSAFVAEVPAPLECELFVCCISTRVSFCVYGTLTSCFVTQNYRDARYARNGHCLSEPEATCERKQFRSQDKLCGPRPLLVARAVFVARSPAPSTPEGPRRREPGIVGGLSLEPREDWINQCKPLNCQTGGRMPADLHCRE